MQVYKICSRLEQQSHKKGTKSHNNQIRILTLQCLIILMHNSGTGDS